MRQFIIPYSPTKHPLTVEKIIEQAIHLSGEVLDVEYIHEEQVKVKFRNYLPVDIYLEENKIVLLQHGLFKSYLVLLIATVLQEMGLEVPYRVHQWAKKPYREIRKWEIWWGYLKEL